MTKQTDSIIRTVPAAAELRKVPGFDPLRYLRRTTSKKSGEPVLKLDLPYKKLWFRLACPNSRTLLKPLRITDQMAIFEAQLFLDRSDTEPIANFTSTMMARNVPGGRYIQAAQDEALNEALDNAGFGIQLADLVEAGGGSGYGSEIPLAQVEAATGVVKQLAPVEQEETPVPAAVQEPQTVPITVEPVTTPPAVEVRTQAQSEQPAVAVTVPPIVETSTAPDALAETPTEEPPADTTGTPKNETADVLHLLGGIPQAAVPEVENELQAQTAPTVEAAQLEQPAEEPAAPVTYTEDMSVEEIREHITVEQAMAVTVDFGTCKGWTLGQVLDRRPSSLRFYVFAAKEASNVLKAAASLLLDGMTQKKAG